MADLRDGGRCDRVSRLRSGAELQAPERAESPLIRRPHSPWVRKAWCMAVRLRPTGTPCFTPNRSMRLCRRRCGRIPTSRGARHNLFAAQYELQAVAGTALPQIAVGAKATRSRVNGSFLYEPPEALQVTANQFNLGPSLAYDLDVFGRIRRSIESQAAQTEQVGHQALNVYITLVNQVVMTAFGLAAAVEQINVTRRLVDDLQEQFDLTQHWTTRARSPTAIRFRRRPSSRTPVPTCRAWRSNATSTRTPC